MRNIYINRLRTSENGTFGEMKFDDPASDMICVTCEPPWHNNAPEISCIPPGTYQCIPHNSPDHPNTWEVTGVPNRAAILIHNGNTAKDTEGCVLVGENFGELNGLPAILNSNHALMQLRTLLPPEFMLSLQWIN